MKILSLLVLAACGHSTTTPEKPDATVAIDAAPIPPDACAVCGAACCTPAADCTADACACPANFVPEMPTLITGVVVANLPQIPGLMAAIGQFDQTATERDAILVAYDPTTAPVGVDIDLASSTDVKVGFGYQIDANQNIRASYRATTGTLHLTSACAAGVTGTLTDATLEEIEIFTSLDPIAGGCTTMVPSVTFAIAKACDP